MTKATMAEVSIKLEAHAKQDELFSELIEKRLTSIDAGVEHIKGIISPAMTQIAVLENKLTDHITDHAKETSTNRWFFGIMITVITFLSNLGIWAFNHVLK